MKKKIKRNSCNINTIWVINYPPKDPNINMKKTKILGEGIQPGWNEKEKQQENKHTRRFPFLTSQASLSLGYSLGIVSNTSKCVQVKISFSG